MPFDFIKLLAEFLISWTEWLLCRALEMYSTGKKEQVKL